MSNSSVAIDGTHLARASIDGVGVIDETEIVFANDPLAEMYGYEEGQQLVGRSWQELVTPVDRSVSPSDLLARAREEGNWRGRGIGEKRNGDQIPIELSMQTTEDGIVCVIRDVTERREHERELDRYETILDTVDDGVYVLNEDLRVEMANERFYEMLAQFGFSPDEVRNMHAHDLVVREEERAALEATIERALERESSTGSFEMSAETPDGERIVCESRFRLYPEADEHRGCIGILRDITERKEREETLERQRDELDTLNRINELLLAVARDLFESPMEEDIEQIVCTRLADSDLYRFAWIGKPEVGGNRLVPDASAGVDDDYVESITITTDDNDTGRGPGGRAFRTGTIQVSQDVQTDPTFEPWRDAAIERDVRSAAAVPLTYDGTTYGILAVYASRPLAFSRREQRGFEILGEAIGYAINANRTRQLLFAERVVELEFQLVDTTDFVFAATERLDSALSLEGYLSTRDGSWLMYFTLPETDAGRFVDAVREEAGVESIRTIGDGSEQVVAVRTSSSFLDELAALGGRVKAGTLDDGHGTVTVEVPHSTGVGEFVEQIRSMYPEAELLAKRDDERPIERSAWLDGKGPIELTSRQRQALEAAYHAGYFEWPRESKAEEVAALLDVSRPTFQAHLRKAERELLSTFIDGAEKGGVRTGQRSVG